jgi:ABC-2 type transport system ATP-binding protein
MAMIKVKNLTKKYNGLKAVDNISFEVKQGETFGILGPNGAGKTTTLEILEGLRKPTYGTAFIDKLSI